jgi:hypothetical protein
MEYSSPAIEEKGRKAYEKQKAERMRNNSADQLVNFVLPTQAPGEIRKLILMFNVVCHIALASSLGNQCSLHFIFILMQVL